MCVCERERERKINRERKNEILQQKENKMFIKRVHA